MTSNDFCITLLVVSLFSTSSFSAGFFSLECMRAGCKEGVAAVQRSPCQRRSGERACSREARSTGLVLARAPVLELDRMPRLCASGAQPPTGQCPSGTAFMHRVLASNMTAGTVLACASRVSFFDLVLFLALFGSLVLIIRLIILCSLRLVS